MLLGQICCLWHRAICYPHVCVVKTGKSSFSYTFWCVLCVCVFVYLAWGGGGGWGWVSLPQDPSEYPRRVQPNQLFVDMDREVVFVPINGQPVPLSIHTIKNVTQPDPDNHCHYLRINFFASGTVRERERAWSGRNKDHFFSISSCSYSSTRKRGCRVMPLLTRVHRLRPGCY